MWTNECMDDETIGRTDHQSMKKVIDIIIIVSWNQPGISFVMIENMRDLTNA